MASTREYLRPLLLLVLLSLVNGLRKGGPSRMVEPVHPPHTQQLLLDRARELALAVRETVGAVVYGAVLGYLAIQSIFFVLDLPSLLKMEWLGTKKCSTPQVTDDTAAAPTDTVAGHWVLDPTRSESLEPFLRAVGVPGIIARLTGRRGKPLTIVIADAGSITVTIGSNAAEQLELGKTTIVTTPGGKVEAEVEADSSILTFGKPLWHGFTVTKRGPAQGHVTTERRELVERDTLRVIVSHWDPAKQIKTEVTRIYTRF